MCFDFCHLPNVGSQRLRNEETVNNTERTERLRVDYFSVTIPFLLFFRCKNCRFDFSLTNVNVNQKTTYPSIISKLQQTSSKLKMSHGAATGCNERSCIKLRPTFMSVRERDPDHLFSGQVLVFKTQFSFTCLLVLTFHLYLPTSSSYLRSSSSSPPTTQPLHPPSTLLPSLNAAPHPPPPHTSTRFPNTAYSLAREQVTNPDWDILIHQACNYLGKKNLCSFLSAPFTPSLFCAFCFLF